MSKQGEVHVDLSEEQWAMMKAALEGEIADVRAENARLQERVEKLSRGRKEAYNRMAQAQGQLEMTLETGTAAYLSWRTANDALKRERDEARARAERRKEALKPFLDAVPPNPDFTDADEVKVFGLQMDELDIANARATIEEEE